MNGLYKLFLSLHNAVLALCKKHCDCSNSDQLMIGQHSDWCEYKRLMEDKQ